jgi:hypothetical protein
MVLMSKGSWAQNRRAEVQAQRCDKGRSACGARLWFVHKIYQEVRPARHTPKHGSRLNLVEGLLSKLARSAHIRVAMIT